MDGHVLIPDNGDIVMGDVMARRHDDREPTEEM
jgi:hypothetical protein